MMMNTTATRRVTVTAMKLSWLLHQADMLENGLERVSLIFFMVLTFFSWFPMSHTS